MEQQTEQAWMRLLQSAQVSQQGGELLLGQLDRYQRDLGASLLATPLLAQDIQADSPLGAQVQSVQLRLAQMVRLWQCHWEDSAAARSLADRFDDKLMLLVYGKFNAGKSSFCNFLAQRVAAHGHSVQFFQLEQGQLMWRDQAFQEGATETTAHLQGVVLGDSLVLLDTPGLHSVTTENSALTQRFTDSADAVLWLSSSSSPGQVQELDELVKELRRQKPLLPVITRSDFLEEDVIGDEIHKVLRNKTAENRRLQEQDVVARAQGKLQQMGVDPHLLQSPVSVSVYAAKLEQPDALPAAGFDDLYQALLDLARPALAYQARKATEVRLHHLEEQIVAPLTEFLNTDLQVLDTQLGQAHVQAESAADKLLQAVWQAVLPCVPELLDRYEADADVQGLYAQVQAHLQQALTTHSVSFFATYGLPEPDCQLSFPVPEGLAYSLAQQGADDDGKYLEDSHEPLYEALQQQLQAVTTQAVSGWLDTIKQALAQMQNSNAALQQQISQAQAELSLWQQKVRA